ncbi:HAMP domain-containing sensor histidine kinase [uncultured Desulfosarcina sp.]|uniref:sensor histidine kinase n=1 Tax=uncultured Desulfosarcina sp. TaxID=218289 RepID=UPI0029C73DAD|nr:HAMP domain-containing sensor histidine kinase [uncultured Desulfosarcina sp.]
MSKKIEGSSSLIENSPFISYTIKPARMAALVAGAYFIFSIIYIYVSSHFAASIVLSKEQLEHVELYKGFLFVLITALLLFAVLFLLFQRLHRKEQAIEKQRDTIVAASKQAAAGLFASSVAHDLNNILTVSQYDLEQLSESSEITASDKKHVERLEKVNNQIRDFSNRLADVSGKHLSSGIRKIDVASEVAVALKLASTHTKVKHCSIKSDLPEKCFAAADESLLHRALLNLILNAGEANGGRGQIFVKLSEDAEYIQIEVHDDGPGIPSEERDRILEPFYTTKPDGSGLGLLSVRYCSEIHGWTLNFGTSHLGGACVHMIIPKSKETSTKAGSKTPQAQGNG